MHKLLLVTMSLISFAAAGSQASAHDRRDDGDRRSRYEGYGRSCESRDYDQWRYERERREREMRARYEWERRERCEDRRRSDDRDSDCHRHHGFRGFVESAFR